MNKSRNLIKNFVKYFSNNFYYNYILFNYYIIYLSLSNFKLHFSYKYNNYKILFLFLLNNRKKKKKFKYYYIIFYHLNLTF